MSTLALHARRAIAGLEALQPLALLAARLYVAQVFFLAGLSKLRDWDITLALFADEYQVPLLPSELAAWLGTGGELVLPVLLALGLFGRFAALGLLVVNAVAVISLAEIGPGRAAAAPVLGQPAARPAAVGTGPLVGGWLGAQPLAAAGPCLTAPRSRCCARACSGWPLCWCAPASAPTPSRCAALRSAWARPWRSRWVRRWPGWRCCWPAG